MLIFPVFVAGFVVFYDIACADDAPKLFAKLAPPGFCLRWRASEGITWPALDWPFIKLAFAQLIVVAIPEELFFRGFIHKLLERRFAPRWRFLGGGIGIALVLSSALFAIGHVLTVSDPRRLAVFFPGLIFGWMRSATGSIFAGVLFHTLCNLFIDALQKAFWG